MISSYTANLNALSTLNRFLSSLSSLSIDSFFLISYLYDNLLKSDYLFLVHQTYLAESGNVSMARAMTNDITLVSHLLFNCGKLIKPSYHETDNARRENHDANYFIHSENYCQCLFIYFVFYQNLKCISFDLFY